MPEKELQANPEPAHSAGARNRTAAPFSAGEGIEITAWADMLSMIGRQNIRLYDLLSRETHRQRAPRRKSGTTIIHELERERSRIARELHAGAGQPLAGIKLNLEMIDEWAEALPEAGRAALARLQTLADQALEQIRAVSHRLHPPDWQSLTTEQALLQLIESSGLRGRLEVKTDIRQLAIEPAHTVKIALYRCAQECISNVMRHSGATRCAISLASDGPTVELRLEDNGRGFPPGLSEGTGIGLLAIREHAVTLGGACEIASALDGVKICIQLPLSVD